MVGLNGVSLPICPDCDVAYLDGESHRCGDRTGAPPSANWITMGGALSGAIAGIVLVTTLSIMANNEPYPIILGVVFGGPFGAVIGALVAARRASRK